MYTFCVAHSHDSAPDEVFFSTQFIVYFTYVPLLLVLLVLLLLLPLLLLPLLLLLLLHYYELPPPPRVSSIIITHVRGNAHATNARTHAGADRCTLVRVCGECYCCCTTSTSASSAVRAHQNRRPYSRGPTRTERSKYPCDHVCCQCAVLRAQVRPRGRCRRARLMHRCSHHNAQNER